MGRQPPVCYQKGRVFFKRKDAECFNGKKYFDEQFCELFLKGGGGGHKVWECPQILGIFLKPSLSGSRKGYP